LLLHEIFVGCNISWKLLPILKEHFGECAHMDDIPELEFPAKDAKIWQYAKDNEYTIITRDNDFNDLIAIRDFPPKIIWLRTGIAVEN
jgi:predicted nuclease of predicted toxin-antitoxin system